MKLIKKLFFGSLFFLLASSVNDRFPVKQNFDFSSLETKVLTLSQSYNQNTGFPQIEYKRDEEKIKNLRFLKTFNNVYKTGAGITGNANGKPFKTVICGTTYNIVDEDGRSFYIGTAHTLKPYHPLLKDVILHQVKIYDISGKDLEAKIEEIDEKNDFAILSTSKDDYKPQGIKPIRYKELIPGEECYVIGYPNGAYRTIKKCNIAGVACNTKTKEVKLSLDELITPGYSGGPVFVVRDGKLRFAGYVTSRDPNMGVSNAVPYDTIAEKLKKYD